MMITVNGENQTINDAGITVADLLKLNKVEMPEMVSVQVNGAFVDRKEFPTKKIADQDVVDFLYFMGGGSRS